MLNAKGLDPTIHYPFYLQFRVNWTAQVGDIVRVCTSMGSHTTRVTKIDSVEDGGFIVCFGSIISAEEVTAGYKLSAVHDAEARLATRWCNTQVETFSLSGGRALNARWVACGKEVGIDASGWLDCWSCGPVLFRETETGQNATYPKPFPRP